jgi:predicted negative regulator of RcsB-dependent stress response
VSAKMDKEMLKNTDIFISTSDKIFEFIERHFKTFTAILCLILVIAIGYVGYGYVLSSQERHAAEALYQPEAALKKVFSDRSEARSKKMLDLANSKALDKAKIAKLEDVQPIDYSKDYAPLVDKVKTEIANHASTKAAMVSALNLAFFLLEQKQFSEALAVLDLPKYQPGKGDTLEGFWLMHRGLVYLENQKPDEALAAYQTVVNSPALKVFHPESLLKLGVCYDLKGNNDKARETFEKLGREFPETEASATAQQYLRLLDLKSQKAG